jgi:3-dehydroquinate dehydratase/shikimate dehydrogenase
MTYLTVPITASNLEQANQQIKQALSAGAEALELRTDYLEDLTIEQVKKAVAEAKAIAGPKVPIIVTSRDKHQGGVIDYSMRLRVEVLTTALKAGVEFIDFEYDNFRNTDNQEKIRLALSQNAKARLILSAHNFNKKFDNIRRLHREILSACSAAIPKLVYTANHINDCFEAFDLLRQTGGQRIVFCMGQSGIISRILAKKLGSCVTFASLNEKTATANGQLTIDQLRRLYRFDSINSDTEIYGVIADPVGHSLSPEIHNACFAEKNINKLYLPLLVEGGKEGFDAFLRNVIQRKWLSFRGFSVTIPHKQNALNFAHSNQGFVEPLAEKIGAVNTLLITADGRPKAYNTDYTGALDAIISGMKIKQKVLKRLSVAVIGAGGVARAIVAGLSDAGAKIKIYNRTIEKAQRLAEEFGCAFAGLDELANLDTKLLINCTSIGMHPDVNATPVPKEYLKRGMAVFDTVYNPARTLLLKQAKRKKLKTIDGLSMFINQACSQFKLFTGQNANLKLMRKVVCNYLK